MATLLLCATTGSATAGGTENTYPAAIAAGHWVADARMSSSLAKTPETNYWWVGRMWGEIAETGKVTMRAENGCSILGVLTDRSLEGLRGEVEITRCAQTSMNRRYRATVYGGPVDGRGKGLRISLASSQHGGGNGLLDTWSVEGAFIRYQPTN
ncbi:MAG: hypothetical protein E6R08_01220 [Nevskiaceae bacterium]|nr:MAG: hypothetical protein E6R08_01220 [Nevskiaceae bacterium]